MSQDKSKLYEVWDDDGSTSCTMVFVPERSMTP
jgi:hypothetical protein